MIQKVPGERNSLLLYWIKIESQKKIGWKWYKKYSWYTHVFWIGSTLGYIRFFSTEVEQRFFQPILPPELNKKCEKAAYYIRCITIIKPFLILLHNYEVCNDFGLLFLWLFYCFAFIKKNLILSYRTLMHQKNKTSKSEKSQIC